MSALRLACFHSAPRAVPGKAVERRKVAAQKAVSPTAARKQSLDRVRRRFSTTSESRQKRSRPASRTIVVRRHQQAARQLRSRVRHRLWLTALRLVTLQVPIVLHPMPQPVHQARPVVRLQVNVARTRPVTAEREHVLQAVVVLTTHVPLRN